MAIRMRGVRRFLTTQFAVLAVLGSAACATPVDDGVDDGQPKQAEGETVDTPPVANGSGVGQANGFGTGGSGSGGSGSGGSGSEAGSGGGSAGGATSEPGLAAAFSFEDADTNVSDDSGNGNHGTVEGTGVSMGDTGKFGKAVSFSGLDGRIVVPGSSELEFKTGATIEFWIKLNGTSGGTILTHVSSSGDGLRVRTNQGNLQVFFISSGTSASITTDSGVLGAAWTHVAVTNDGSSLKLYLNGKLNRTDLGGHLASAGTDLIIGKSSTTDNALNGSLDELNWWTVARSAEEICEDAGGQYSSTSCTL